MYAFSEVGVVMLSSVLRSQVAISVSIQIANAFLKMRRFLKDNAEVFLRIEVTIFRLLYSPIFWKGCTLGRVWGIA